MSILDSKCAKQMAQNFGLGATLGASVGIQYSTLVLLLACMQQVGSLRLFVSCVFLAGAAYGTWDAFKFKVCKNWLDQFLSRSTL